MFKYIFSLFYVFEILGIYIHTVHCTVYVYKNQNHFFKVVVYRCVAKQITKNINLSL